MAAAEPDPLTADPKWLAERRFEYAWRYFEFHAGQRMTVFNFFILFSGILANAYGLLFRAGEHFAAGAVAFTAAVISLFFLFLEHRNEELVHLAEDNLRKLENDFLFRGFEAEIAWPRRRRWLFWWEPSSKVTRQLGILLRQDADGPSPYSHGIWIPVIQFLIAAAFLAAAVAGFATGWLTPA